MRRAVLVIATVYSLLGAAYILPWLLGIFIKAPWVPSSEESGPGWFLLLIAYGLAHFRNWARGLVLFLSALLAAGGILGLIVCVGHVAGYVKAAGGMIVDRPLLAVFVTALMIAAGLGQQWFFTRNEVRRLFDPEAGDGISGSASHRRS